MLEYVYLQLLPYFLQMMLRVSQVDGGKLEKTKAVTHPPHHSHLNQLEVMTCIMSSARVVESSIAFMTLR